MIWKLALALSVAANIFAGFCIYGAIRYEEDLHNELSDKDLRIRDLELRPEAITTLTAAQFRKFMEIARTESSSDALPHWK